MPTSMRVEIAVPYHQVDESRSRSKESIYVPHSVRWIAGYLRPPDAKLIEEILYCVILRDDRVAIQALDGLYQWAGQTTEVQLETFRDVRTLMYHLSVNVPLQGPAHAPFTPTPAQQTLHAPGLKPENPSRRLNFRGLKSISTDDSKGR